jgi:glycosyltransferase involved in cell wall biosynthesis
VTPLRVAVLINQIAGGGAERFVVELASGLATRGAEVTLCASRSDPDPAASAQLADAGVELLTLGRRRRGQPLAWRPLVRQLRSGRYDVLNTHLHSSNVYGALLSATTRARFVATEHGSTADNSRTRQALDRALVARRAWMTVAVSDHTRDRLLARGYPRDRVRVIAPAPPELLAPPLSRAAARSALSLADWDGPVIGTICALRAEKRIDLLIAASELLSSRRPVRVVVLGDGPERATLERGARERGLGGVLSFAGWRDDAASLLPAFDAFVLSSDTEGTPLALIEAMRAGSPIVATAVGGVPALLAHGGCAVLVEASDPRALAAGIEQLMDDGDLAQRLGKDAAERARTAYSLEAALSAWYALFLEARLDSRTLAATATA